MTTHVLNRHLQPLITQKLLSEPPGQILAAMLHRSMCKQSTLAPAVRRHEQLADARYAGEHPRALARRQARAVGCHKLVVMPASQFLAQTRPPLCWRLPQTLASVLRVPGKQQHGTCAKCAALLWHGSTCTWAWTPSRHKCSVLCASMWPCRGATGWRCSHRRHIWQHGRHAFVLLLGNGHTSSAVTYSSPPGRHAAARQVCAQCWHAATATVHPRTMPAARPHSPQQTAPTPSHTLLAPPSPAPLPAPIWAARVSARHLKALKRLPLCIRATPPANCAQHRAWDCCLHSHGPHMHN